MMLWSFRLDVVCSGVIGPDPLQPVSGFNNGGDKTCSLTSRSYFVVPHKAGGAWKAGNLTTGALIVMPTRIVGAGGGGDVHGHKGRSHKGDNAGDIGIFRQRESVVMPRSLISQTLVYLRGSGHTPHRSKPEQYYWPKQVNCTTLNDLVRNSSTLF